MKSTASLETLQCSVGCDSILRECLNSGEDESVCRMKRVPCDCKCTSDETLCSS